MRDGSLNYSTRLLTFGNHLYLCSPMFTQNRVESCFDATTTSWSNQRNKLNLSMSLYWRFDSSKRRNPSCLNHQSINDQG